MSCERVLCERVLEVEDWTLGLLEASEAEAVATHVVGCAECQAAKAMFEDERSLFQARARVVEAPLPALMLPRPSVFARLGAGRAMSAIAALAACVAAVVGGARAFTPDDCAAPIATMTTTTFAPPASEEVLTCKSPVSEARLSDAPLFSSLAPAPLASYEPTALACVDRATCDLQDDAL